MFQLRRVLFAVILTTLHGCASQSAEPMQQPYSPAKHRAVRIQSCFNRSGFRGSSDLAPLVTGMLADKISAAKLFEVARDASLILTREVEGFAGGSAFPRAGLDGWTRVRIAVILWERPGDRVVAAFRGSSSVTPGGQNLIGADRYVVSLAVNDIVRQLEMWTRAGSRGPAQ